MNSTNDKPRPLVSEEEEDKISRNVLIWLNTFPDIPDAVLEGNPMTPINFEFKERLSFNHRPYFSMRLNKRFSLEFR